MKKFQFDFWTSAEKCQNFMWLLKVRSISPLALEKQNDIRILISRNFFNFLPWRSRLDLCYETTFLFELWHTEFLAKSSKKAWHSVEKWKIYCHPKKISSNQLFSIFFGKNVTFTKFLLKKCDSKFPQFPHCGIVL